MTAKFKKIRITGGSGSGKTYLGKLLEERTSIRLTSIDDLIYDFSKTHKFSNKRSDEKIYSMYFDVLKKDSWILDGGFFSKTTDSYKQADLIIFVNPPFLRRIFNTFSRFFIRLFSGKYEGFGNFLLLTRQNIRSRNKWAKRRPNEFKQLYPDKVQIFSSADSAYDWFLKNS